MCHGGSDANGATGSGRYGCLAGEHRGAKSGQWWARRFGKSALATGGRRRDGRCGRVVVATRGNGVIEAGQRETPARHRVAEGP